MTEGRPEIPTELKRAVLVEAGHRCAIPTCRQTPVEMAHIIPWAKIKSHTFDNLIALCPTCHTRFDRGEIDRKSMLQYKANLEVLNHRYTEVERQLLKAFIRRWQRAPSKRREGHYPYSYRRDIDDPTLDDQGPIRIDYSMAWTISNLIEDKMVSLVALPKTWAGVEAGTLNAVDVRLTHKGVDLIAHWMEAEPL
ncbi:HNH endonuclease [Streptomyces sp. NPDC059070]|uniref:HNH endonuclease n=1 Tax=Streptomyces sp. NPDC059070 TaxID=3346713 RepID=UPI0036A009A1